MHAHPAYVNQTVAGTIATGTHGTSITYRSLSSHVLAVKAVLANGTSVLISEESHPFLLKAFRVNVGRLGVVTEVKIRIYKEILARRTHWSAVPLHEMMLRLKQAQEIYKATGDLPGWLDGTELLWMPTNSTVCSRPPRCCLHICYCLVRDRYRRLVRQCRDHRMLPAMVLSSYRRIGFLSRSSEIQNQFAS